MADPFIQHGHLVGGLWCHEVLELLPEAFDGHLGAATLEAVQAHVSGCDRCASLGARYGALVARLRASGGAPPIPDDVAERLDAALAGVGAG
jgi:anti-sigma factor RsiW